MKIKEYGKDLEIAEVSDFDIAQTLECGQCFHFNRIDDHDYALAANGMLLHAAQTDTGIVLYDTDKGQYENIWRSYFDMDRDYSSIKEYLVRYDSRLEDAINAMGGVRILNQEFFETLM